jgi:hypothetical protein
MDDPRTVWSLDTRPGPEPDDERCTARMVGAAILAPSGHNTQPWRFTRRGDTIEILADRTRALPVVDPDDRELVISCGCALKNMEIAARAMGRVPRSELLPDPSDPDLLARVSIAERGPVDGEDASLFACIPRRRTNRGAFVPEPLPQRATGRIASAVAAEGARLVVLDEPQAKDALADLIADGDRLQMADRRFRRELAAWMVSNRSARLDGIPGYGLGMSDLMSMVGPLLVRRFDVGRSQAAKDRDLATGAPALCVLLTDGDGPRDHLVAGRAHQLATLVATSEGLWTSYLNQPIEVAELRSRVAAAVGEGGHPQLLTRIGRSETPPHPTPRRPPSAVAEP